MIISADRIIIGDGKQVIEQGAVMMKGAKILGAGPARELRRLYPDEPERTLPGCTLMPGLIDMHTHIADYYEKNGSLSEPENEMLMALCAGKRMEDTLRAGVTTIRDVSSPLGIGRVLKLGAASGYLHGPRILTCLEGLCITGGHGWEMNGAVKEIDGTEEGRKAVRKNIRDGADWIKILDSEGYRGEEFSQEELDTIVSEAHRFGRKVAAHAGYGPSIEMCIQAGCDTIEHGTHLTVEQAERMRRNGQAWVPTLYVFHYVYEQVKAAANTDMAQHFDYLEDTERTYRSTFKELYDTGVLVAAGTDTDCCGHPEASPIHEECRLMVEYGLTPLEAIACATHHGALALGLGDQIGLLQEGYLADVIAVRGNPLQDIGALSGIASVWQGGICVYESESAHLCQ
ncbi:MAG: amidohydrolase family protein [Candidatus Limivivens sp.]|nr:amidohydrolase family protein [Candidatus Limivivens sp.]